MPTFSLKLQFRVLCTYQYNKFTSVKWAKVPKKVKDFVMDHIDGEGFYDNEWLAAHGHTPGELLEKVYTSSSTRVSLKRKCKDDRKKYKKIRYIKNKKNFTGRNKLVRPPGPCPRKYRCM